MEIKLNTRGGLEVDKLVLAPGYNTVADDVWTDAEKHPLVQTLLAQDVLEIATPVKPRKLAPGAAPKQLRGIALPEVKTLIAECTDRAQLLAWLPTDSRKDVKAALQKRADALYEIAVKEAANGDSDD
jgi:hypothetical protein